MKTPREILLGKHQPKMPELDAIRQEVVGEVADAKERLPSPIRWERETVEQPRVSVGRKTLGRLVGSSSLASQIWVELILPCRRIWTGLAAVWVCLIIFNVSQRATMHPAMAKTASAAESAAVYRDQQRILNELLADRSLPVEAVRPRSYTPKPSSEAVEFLTT